MAITISTVFTDVGKIFAAFANINGFCGDQAPTGSSKWGSNGPVSKNTGTMVSDILTRMQGSGLTSQIAFNNWQTTLSAIDSTLQTQKSVLAALAAQIIITRVNNDVAQQSPASLRQAMIELIRQMQVAVDSVKACTVSATTTASTTLVIRPLSTVPSTNAPPAKFSLNEIASNVGAVDNARAVSATSGALSGQLSPSFNVADVPLAGPGTWSMTTSSPARTTVQCANLEARVQTQIVIGSKENCQLIITAVPPATSLTWQLTPVT